MEDSVIYNGNIFWFFEAMKSSNKDLKFEVDYTNPNIINTRQKLIIRK